MYIFEGQAKHNICCSSVSASPCNVSILEGKVTDKYMHVAKPNLISLASIGHIYMASIVISFITEGTIELNLQKVLSLWWPGVEFFGLP